MVSFAEFVKKKEYYSTDAESFLLISDLRVWVEEQIEVLNREIGVLEGMPNSVQYHDEVWGRLFQIKFCKEMLGGLK